jgi:hypothetical protein
MKIISTFNPTYLALERKTDKWFIFSDESSPLIKIYSPIPSPSGKYCFLISPQFTSSSHPYQVNFKLYPVSDVNKSAPVAELKREIYKSKFSFTCSPVLYSCSIPLRDGLWLSYSFCP